MSLRRVSRLTLLGVLVLLLTAMLSLPVGALAAASKTAVHYVYADDGLCPDTIQGFQITSKNLVPTPGSPYSAGPTSCTETATFGYNTLATTPANSAHGPCLVHSDSGRPQVESFAINPATGALTLASAISALNKNPMAEAQDIHISSNGNLVYVNVAFGSPNNLTSLSLGAGCVLTLDKQLAAPTQDYTSLLLISPSRMVALDGSKQGIDTYALTPSGGMKLINSASGQFTDADGLASQTFVASGKQITELYTGQFAAEFQQGSVAQGGQYNPVMGTFTPLPTSPQTDAEGISLDYLLYNTANHYLIGTESFGNSLGVWSAKGSGFTFFGHVRLPETGAEPSAMAQIGSQLFTVAHDVLYRCTITSAAPGVNNCTTAANLSGVDGQVEGVAIL